MFFFHFRESLESNLPRGWKFLLLGQHNAKLVVMVDTEPYFEVSNELDPIRYKNTSDAILTHGTVFQLHHRENTHR